MNWGAFDLNLLIVFDAVMQERNVTRAGGKIGLSQPAVSHALSRLRYMLKDELFIRTPDGMMPTPRAEQLAAPLRRALSDMQLALEPETFVPQEATRLFVLALNNYAAVILAPALVTAVISTAPGIRLDLRPTGMRDMPALLDRGEFDLAIGTFEDAGERFAAAPLLEDWFVVALRRDHPAAQRELTEEALAGLSFLEISSSGEDSSFVDQWLGTRGLARNITHRAPRLSAAAILSSTNMVAVLSRRLAEHWVQTHPFRPAGFPLHRPLSAPGCSGIAGSMISPLICGCASLSIRRPRANKLYQSTASSGKECAFFGKQRPDGEPAKRQLGVGRRLCVRDGAITASRKANSNAVRAWRWTPTPLFKNMRVGLGNMYHFPSSAGVTAAARGRLRRSEP